MKIYYMPLKLICAVLAAALLLAGLPVALAAGSFEAFVSVDSMNVYAEKAPHAIVGTLPKGTMVTVTAWSGNAALITSGSLSGIAQVSDMTRSETRQVGETSQSRTMVTNRNTRIYQRASTSSRYVKIPAGTTLTLLSVSGKAARVSLNGKVGYTAYSHLSEPGDAPQATPQPTPQTTPQPGETTIDTIQTGNMAVVTTQQADVYEGPYNAGEFVTVSANTKLTLLAIQGEWAMVSRNGAIGYTLLSNLKKDSSSSTGKEDAKLKANPFPSGSNEYTIYSFLTGDMGFNRAAAMGIMANIYYESGYKPVINGDSGTSYGICQWHAGRKSNLINWCNDNGLDYTTLEGQLKFLQYELPTRYRSVYDYLRQVDNTADGAYDAAYYFCFNFEAPAARTSQSTKRGNYAKDTLFPKT